MRTLVNVLRLAMAIAIMVAIAAQLRSVLTAGTFVVWNFFGYFTIQSNIIAFVALLVAVVVGIRRRRRSGTDWTVQLRAAATVYMGVTGLVYNTLLVGGSTDIAFDLQWSNDVLHKIGPVYMIVDWLLFSDRGRLAMSRIWVFLVYPVVWTVVVLVRGATDGWVPYPFLSPSQGYGVVALYCIGIAAFFALLSVVVIWISRLRLIRV
ncbi:Pr6Pr family membrane protein [Curtobacterium sp. RRHDQ10]|uniref:Pr6Pr family membrane protein n=1 Tax=Curtobacterium phyllosphaerae TaxID=3413379 RepID=UPI003BF09380